MTDQDMPYWVEREAISAELGQGFTNLLRRMLFLPVETSGADAGETVRSTYRKLAQIGRGDRGSFYEALRR